MTTLTEKYTSGSAGFISPSFLVKVILNKLHSVSSSETKLELDFVTEEDILDFTESISISKEDKAALKSLNEIWGDDEDGEYEKLYQHHQKLKTHAL